MVNMKITFFYSVTPVVWYIYIDILDKSAIFRAEHRSSSFLQIIGTSTKLYKTSLKTIK